MHKNYDAYKEYQKKYMKNKYSKKCYYIKKEEFNKIYNILKQLTNNEDIIIETIYTYMVLRKINNTLNNSMEMRMLLKELERRKI